MTCINNLQHSSTCRPTGSWSSVAKVIGKRFVTFFADGAEEALSVTEYCDVGQFPATVGISAAHRSDAVLLTVGNPGAPFVVFGQVSEELTWGRSTPAVILVASPGSVLNDSD